MQPSSLPLDKRCIVITRPRLQAAQWCQTLSALGAETLVCSTIHIAPPADWQPVDRVFIQLPQFDWLIFTSANGVRFFCARLFETGRDITALQHLKVAAVGTQTARTLQHYAIHVDVVPTTYRADGLRESFRAVPLEHCQVLWPRAAVTQETLAPTLRAWGANVTEVVVYRTVQACDTIALLCQRLHDHTIDVVTFTSSSAVTALHALLDEEAWGLLRRTTRVACIGPETATTAQSVGLQVDIVPEMATVPALTQAIVAYFARTSRIEHSAQSQRSP